MKIESQVALVRERATVLLKEEPTFKPATKSVPKPEVVPKNPEPVTQALPSLDKQIARSVFDSLLRGPFRYFEKLIENKPLRILYRLVSESARKISESAFVKMLSNEKFTKQDLKGSFFRALEHIPATVVIEPNLFEGAIPRMLAGLGNMAVRLATRFGFYKVNAISHEELNERNVFDELASRAGYRAINTLTEYLPDNAAAGIGTRILEQLLINLHLHVFKPINRLLPKNILKQEANFSS